MYQEVLDALNDEKTTRQHMNKMKNLFDRATDLKLKELIGNVGSEFERWLQEMKKLASRKTQSPVTKQKNVATAKAAREKKFIPSAPMEDGKVPLSVSALIVYCNNML